MPLKSAIRAGPQPLRRFACNYRIASGAHPTTNQTGNPNQRGFAILIGQDPAIGPCFIWQHRAVEKDREAETYAPFDLIVVTDSSGAARARRRRHLRTASTMWSTTRPPASPPSLLRSAPRRPTAAPPKPRDRSTFFLTAAASARTSASNPEHPRLRDAIATGA